MGISPLSKEEAREAAESIARHRKEVRNAHAKHQAKSAGQ